MDRINIYVLVRVYQHHDTTYRVSRLRYTRKQDDSRYYMKIEDTV